MRPPVDVVVPFAGSRAALDDLLASLRALTLSPGDTVTVADNRSDAGNVHEREGVAVVAAPERGSSYFARNRGAEGGSAPWIAFLDADIEPPADLLDRYFARTPEDATAVLAGGVRDEDPGPRPTAVAAFLYGQESMSEDNTRRDERWTYAQTANCLVRRRAFAEVGGFCADIRSGGDADLCFRLREQGWGIEFRPEAAVLHRTRSTLRALIRQRTRHGAGAAWLCHRHPGFLPPPRWAGLAVWTARAAAGAVADLVRGRRTDAAGALVELVSGWAFELGRLAPNHVRPR